MRIKETRDAENNFETVSELFQVISIYSPSEKKLENAETVSANCSQLQTRLD